MLSGTAVDTAFDAADDAALRRLTSSAGIETGVGIPPGTALAVRGDGSTEIIGDGRIAVFRKASSGL
ncbi:MAG: hypothetical protein NVSMB68_03850 [Thermoanaerobaculia bacterium]